MHSRVSSLGRLFAVLLSLSIPGCSDATGPSHIVPGQKGMLKARVDSLALASAPGPLPPEWERRQPHMILAPRQSGALVAWNGSDGAVHVTSLTESNTIHKQDLVFPDTKLGGFAITPTGFGLTAVQDPRLSVAGVNDDGSESFRTLLIGDRPKESKGSKFDPMDFGSSRLVYAGGTFCAFYAHQQNYGDSAPDVHQGDMLVFLDDKGAGKTGGWDWGTSHSLDQRLIHDGQAFVAVSLGDCYPKGITFQRVGAGSKVTLMPIDGNCAGQANGILGGLVKLGGIYAVAFGTTQGRGAQDAGVMFVDAQGKLRRTAWLTALPASDDKSVTRVNSAAYGTDLLVAWMVNDKSDKKDSTFLAVVDTSGKTLLGPDYLAEGFGAGDDFANFNNGEVGWAYARNGKMRIVRIVNAPVTGAVSRPLPGPSAPAGNPAGGFDLLGRVPPSLPVFPGKAFGRAGFR